MDGNDAKGDDEEIGTANATEGVEHLQNHKISQFKSMTWNLPSPIIAQIHLLQIFETHPCDLKLYDNVMKWLSFHGRNTVIDWKNPLWRTQASILDT